MDRGDTVVLTGVNGQQGNGWWQEMHHTGVLVWSRTSSSKPPFWRVPVIRSFGCVCITLVGMYVYIRFFIACVSACISIIYLLLIYRIICTVSIYIYNIIYIHVQYTIIYIQYICIFV